MNNWLMSEMKLQRNLIFIKKNVNCWKIKWIVCRDFNILQMMLVLMRNICKVVKKSLNYFQNEKIC